MSFNKLDSLFDNLQDIINDCQADVTKFVEGNNFRYSLFLICKIY